MTTTKNSKKLRKKHQVDIGTSYRVKRGSSIVIATVTGFTPQGRVKLKYAADTPWYVKKTSVLPRDILETEEEYREAQRKQHAEWEAERAARRAEAERTAVVTVELDFAHDGEGTDLFHNLHHYDCALRVVDPEGPGGGWPVISITGQRDKVRSFVRTAWGEDALNDLLEEGKL